MSKVQFMYLTCFGTRIGDCISRFYVQIRPAMYTLFVFIDLTMILCFLFFFGGEINDSWGHGHLHQVYEQNQFSLLEYNHRRKIVWTCGKETTAHQLVGHMHSRVWVHYEEGRC
jgi:hypothetical protein